MVADRTPHRAAIRNHLRMQRILTRMGVQDATDAQADAVLEEKLADR